MKTTFRALLYFVLVSGIILSSCSGGGEKQSPPSEESITTVEKEPDFGWPDKETMMARGQAIYKEKCIVCHMPDGRGVTAVFPPLAQSDYLLADRVRAVSQVLNGSNEAMVVNGITYTTPMTPQVDNKKDAIAVINYVLNNFGNDGGYVTMDDVRDVEINPIGL